MKVHRVGNSLMVSIPADIARQLRISEGDQVEAKLDEIESTMIVRPLRSMREVLDSWSSLGKPVSMADIVADLREDRQSH